ncbi:MAG: serine hydrolase [Flavisolibacter sp.]|nr:serine hydrolase [Flavisolibacter sp.]
MANIIEEVTGVSIKEYLDKEVFLPLGMKNITFALPKVKQKDLAQYYSVDSNGNLKKELYDPTYSWGTDLFSTAEDYYKFCQLLLNNGQFKGKQFIRPELLKELYKPTVGLNGEAIPWQKGYAFGLGASVRVNNEKADYKGSLGDYGWFGGFNTAFWVDPQKQIIGIVLSQSYHDFYQLSKKVKNIIYSTD